VPDDYAERGEESSDGCRCSGGDLLALRRVGCNGGAECSCGHDVTSSEWLKAARSGQAERPKESQDQSGAQAQAQAQAHPSDDRGKSRVLSCSNRLTGARDYELGHGAPRNTCGEALFARYLSHEARPESVLVFSGYHSGGGQLTFGPDRRRRADVALAIGDGSGRRTLEFHNYHGGAFHLPSSYGGHLRDCPRARQAGAGGFRAQGMSRSVAESLARLSAARGDGEMCPAEEEESPSLERDADALKEAYARALTRVAPDRLAVAYAATFECDFLHRERVEIPGIRHVASRQTPAGGPAQLMWPEEGQDLGEGEERLPPWNWPPPKTSVSEAELVRSVVAGERTYEGFVVIAGGRETARDLPEGTFGFCHQRCRAPVVGEFTAFQGREMEDLDDASMKRSRDNEYTMTRRSFHDGGETISTPYLQFLVRERGLVDFRILHFVHYPLRLYIRPFVTSFLQRRWDISRRNKAGDVRPEDSLMSSCLKLVSIE
jgi:hypothetical protein